MNKETYEALKVVVSWANLNLDENMNKTREAIKQVRIWIDEVAKEYEECEHSWIDSNNDNQEECRICGEIKKI